MIMWRNSEVETALGSPIDPELLTEATIRHLVDGRARESQHLEFKAEPYTAREDRSWTRDHEFAKDVTALANSHGGVIIIGIIESDNIASDDPGMSQDPAAEAQRLRRALINYSSPAPTLFFLSVAKANGRFHMLVVVPPSLQSPHAVLGVRGDNRQPLHFFLRDGADVRPLGPMEVAERHAARLDAASDGDHRLQRVASRGTAALSRRPGIWTYVAISPASPVPGVVNHESVAEAKAWLNDYHFVSPVPTTLHVAENVPIAAPGRICFVDAAMTADGAAPDPEISYLELGVDGTAFAARAQYQDGWSVPEVSLAVDTLLILDAVLQWSGHKVGVFGTADVMIGITHGVEEPGSAVPPLTLQRASAMGDAPRRVLRTRDLHEAPAAQLTIDLASASSAQASIAATHAVLSALLQWFGVVEPDQFGADGSVHSHAWGSVDHRAVERWAMDRQISTSPYGPVW